MLLRKKIGDTKRKEVPNILDLNAADIKSYYFDYSVWDQVAEFILKEKNINWTEKKLRAPLANYKVDYIWLTDSSAKPYYSTSTNDSRLAIKFPIAEDALKAGLFAK